MSAPTGNPIWVNPCGGRPEEVSRYAAPDHMLLTRIGTSSKIALGYATKFASDFVRNVFPGRTIQTQNEEWKDSRYEWLPSKKEIPKNLSEPTPEKHLKELARADVNEVLKNNFRYLQTLAVAMEQVHHDKTRQNNMFAPQFAQMQFKLRQVLCEVETALHIRAPDVHIEDVSRNAMPTDVRLIRDETYRDLRDWIIFRDYMNCLEYVTDVCEYLKDKVD